MPITSDEVPGAKFYSVEALREHSRPRLAYEAAAKAFETDGDERILRQRIFPLGYDERDVIAHVANPGYRVPRHFM